jgi:hypothetical protein
MTVGGNPWDDPGYRWDQTNDHDAWATGAEVPPYRACIHGEEADRCPACWADANPIPVVELATTTCGHGVPDWEQCGRCGW